MADENANLSENQDDQQLEALRAARDAQKRADKRAKDEANARAEVERELAEVRGQIRNDNLVSILSKIGAPEGIASVYPQDADVSEDAVTKFVTELGVNLQPKREDWKKYEAMQRETAIPQTEPDPYEAMAKENEDALRKMVDWYAPQNDAAKTAEAWDKAQQIQDESDPQIWAKKMPELTPSATGFGGRIDPPAWAQRAKAFKSRG